MRFGFLFLATFILSACQPKMPQTSDRVNAFQADLLALQDYFQIPGIAAMVLKGDEVLYEDYLGYVSLETEQPLSATTHFPIASITKVFTGVLAMQQVEAGNLDLDRPFQQFFPEMGAGPDILVKHLLSHTSQGLPGTQFYYSSRFSAMTGVLEKTSGQDFATLMQEKIFDPLQMQETFLLKNEAQTKALEVEMAQPYAMNDALEPGFIDYGYSASAGIVSTLNDLRLFNRALDNYTLISEESTQKMFSPFQGDLPYGDGIFSQTFDGQGLVWAYGQYDCYSSLFLKIPEQDLTLILLANNNLMSDPPRLINGDASSSLFVLSFLQNFIYEPTGDAILKLETSAGNSAVFNQEKLKAQAQAAAFMSRWEDEEFQRGQVILERLFETYPAYETYADLNLLHTLNFLKLVAQYKELAPVEQFDKQLENIGQQLLEADPLNPYAHINLANYFAGKGNTELARYHFESIIKLPNFDDNWYTKEATSWINDHLE